LIWWENVRQLATASTGHYTLSFEYNDEGIRTLKTVNWVDYNYHLSNSLVIAEEWGNNLIIYLYDAEGAPIGMQYRNTSYAEGAYDTYWFEKNLQGDIVAVYSETGTKLIAYTYDAWGNFSTTYYNGGASTTATYNPFRYRGYYYDVELGFYYLNSRYYDPAIGRFINPDDVSLLGANGDFPSLNLYAYCGNNPVARADDGGEFWNIVIGAVVGAAVNAVTTAVNSYLTNGSIDWESVGISAAVGAISGGVAATGLSAITQAAITAGASAVGSVFTDLHSMSKNSDLNEITLQEVGKIAFNAVGAAAVGFGSSIVGTAVGKIVSGGLEQKGADMVFRGKIGAGCYSKAQARNMVSQGNKLINTARGISSVVGTVVTWPGATAMSLVASWGWWN